MYTIQSNATQRNATQHNTGRLKVIMATQKVTITVQVLECSHFQSTEQPHFVLKSFKIVFVLAYICDITTHENTSNSNIRVMTDLGAAVSRTSSRFKKWTRNLLISLALQHTNVRQTLDVTQMMLSFTETLNNNT